MSGTFSCSYVDSHHPTLRGMCWLGLLVDAFGACKCAHKWICFVIAEFSCARRRFEGNDFLKYLLKFISISLQGREYTVLVNKRGTISDVLDLARKQIDLNPEGTGQLRYVVPQYSQPEHVDRSDFFLCYGLRRHQECDAAVQVAIGNWKVFETHSWIFSVSDNRLGCTKEDAVVW